eukprot:Pgem_evm1s11501
MAFANTIKDFQKNKVVDNDRYRTTFLIVCKTINALLGFLVGLGNPPGNPPVHGNNNYTELNLVNWFLITDCNTKNTVIA